VAEIDGTKHVGKRREGKSESPIDAVRAARELLARPQAGQLRCDGDREGLASSSRRLTLKQAGTCKNLA
jgi:hypothetical protein